MFTIPTYGDSRRTLFAGDRNASFADDGDALFAAGELLLVELWLLAVFLEPPATSAG